MSTSDRPRTVAPPPLVDGERLDRASFHERYEAMPPRTRAELIGGVVHIMASPISYTHDRPNVAIVAWLVRYEQATPGVETLGHVSLFLGDRTEVQPDAALRILPEAGGETRPDGEYLAGPPDLIVEVARSSRRKDLGVKRDDYEATGIGEYLVVAIGPDEVFHFARLGEALVRQPSDADGLMKSEVFPGLWLDPAALYRDDLAGLFAALDCGLATPEHAAFVERLAEERRGRAT